MRYGMAQSQSGEPCSRRRSRSRAISIFCCVTTLGRLDELSCSLSVGIWVLGIFGFFLLFSPTCWLWMLSNHRFNCFDPEVGIFISMIFACAVPLAPMPRARHRSGYQL